MFFLMIIKASRHNHSLLKVLFEKFVYVPYFFFFFFLQVCFIVPSSKAAQRYPAGLSTTSL